jgi:hypothetical protein
MSATRITKQDLGTSVFAAPGITLGTSNVAGSSGQAPATDATILAFDATAPTTAASGDAAAVGTATVAARRDHKHGMPTLPTLGTPGLTLGTANAAGAASTAVRTDATILAFDATVPVTQASGDTADAGTAAVAARRDHKHGMPTIPTVPSHVVGEVAATSWNGTVATATLAHTPTASSLAVYKNGLRQQVGAGNDYTLATATITFLAGNIPQAGDVVQSDYRY